MRSHPFNGDPFDAMYQKSRESRVLLCLFNNRISSFVLVSRNS